MAKFSDIVGQEELKQHIHNAIEMDKVSHARSEEHTSELQSQR